MTGYTCKTLQFTKFDGTDYYVWSNNIVCDLCLSEPPINFPNFMRTACPIKVMLSTLVSKDRQDLLNVLQSRGYLVWEQCQDSHKCWLIRDDAAIGSVCNAI